MSAAQPPPPRRRRWLPLLATLALAIDVLVCVPFVFDPWDVRGVAGTAAREYRVVLAEGHDSAALRRFFATHKALALREVPGATGSVLVSVPNEAGDALRTLRDQAFTHRLVPAGVIFCGALSGGQVAQAPSQTSVAGERL